MSDKFVRVELGYRPALLAAIKVDYETLRKAGVHMEDTADVEAAAERIAIDRITHGGGGFDPLSDWFVHDKDDMQIDVNNGVTGAEIAWDDLTAEEQARVPESDRR